MFQKLKGKRSKKEASKMLQEANSFLKLVLKYLRQDQGVALRQSKMSKGDRNPKPTKPRPGRIPKGQGIKKAK